MNALPLCISGKRPFPGNPSGVVLFSELAASLHLTKGPGASWPDVAGSATPGKFQGNGPGDPWRASLTATAFRSGSVKC